MTLPTRYQRLEGLMLLLTVLYLYADLGYSFIWFMVLLFVVDVSMVGYIANNRLGAHLYNIGHSLIVPLGVTVVAFWLDNNTLLAVALIWLAHIGLDRALGFGLKTTKGFADTHLGKIGHE